VAGLRAGVARRPDCDEDESDNARERRSEEKKPGRIGRFFFMNDTVKGYDGRLTSHKELCVYSRASHRKIPDSPKRR
jgi:hypothetical protein